jgi:GTP cyclohydrolase I
MPVMLEDVQNRHDDRGIALDRVGISGLRYPISVWDLDHGKQETLATVAMSVALRAESKGTHMSRFVEILDGHAGELTQATIPIVLAEMQRRLDSRSAQLEVAFPYFRRRVAPVSGASALMDYDCRFRASADGDMVRFALSVQVPVTSVCPCSKAISDYGAHNQRGVITIEVSPNRDQDGQFAVIWIEELIGIAEGAASSPVYPLLKRSDERYVTMAGYDNPVFVEDMVRVAAARLQGDERIGRLVVEARNDESIHNHDAFARLAWPPSERS